MHKLYFTSFFPSLSFLTSPFKSHSFVLRKISGILFCATLLLLKTPPASGMTPSGPVHPVNIHKGILHVHNAGAVPSSENFDEVTLTNAANGTDPYPGSGPGISKGSSPRTIGDWVFSMVDNTGANSSESFVDVTNNKTNSTHLADNGGDKALSMNGQYGVVTAAVIKPSVGATFSLSSFYIENGSASSPDYTVVGYLGGVEKISQDFTALEWLDPNDGVGDNNKITLTDAKWKNIDEFRIVRKDGSKDVSFYIDDIVVGAPTSSAAPTTITSIKRASSDPTNANSVNYTVTFGAPVTGLTKSNFSLTASGIFEAAIGTITGSGATYTVPVLTGIGDGTITLNLANSTGMNPGISTTLPFTGETYTIDRIDPLLHFGAPSATTTSTGPVTYAITYTDAHPGITSSLTAADITLNKTGTATGTVSVSGSGTSYIVAISGITGTGTLGISVAAGTAKDAAGNETVASGASSIFNVTTSSSSPPVIGNLDGDKVTFTEGGYPVLRDAGGDATVTDGDSPDFLYGKLTASITGNRDPSEDQLGILLTGAFNLSGGILTYNGDPMGTFTAGTGTDDCVVDFTTNVATPASVGELIRALTYYNTDQTDPSTGKRTISVTVSDGAGGISTPVTDTVVVIGVNDPPTLSAAGNDLTFTEGGGMTASLFSTVSASTAESGQGLLELDLSVSNVSNGADEKLYIDSKAVPLTDGATGQTTNHFNYSVSLSGNTASVKVTSADPLILPPQMQDLVDGITYANTSANPTVGTRTITLTSLQDNGGTANGGIDTKALSIPATVKVVAGNVAPVVATSSGTTAFTEGNNVPSTPVVIDGGITVSDADNAKLIGATVKITRNFNASDALAFSNDGTTMGDIVAAYNQTNGVLNLSATNGATVAAWQSAFRSVTFNNSSQNPDANDRTISFAISDGINSSASATKIVSVTPVDDVPVITSNGGGSTAAINVSEGTQAVTTVKATDADATALNQAISYSLSGGADQGLFSIDGTTGALTFKSAPNFDNPSDNDGDGDYEVTVKASDGSAAADEQAITVTVTDVNDHTPVITSNGGGSTASINVSENTTAVTTVKATDADAGTTLTYSLSGGIDQGLFSINGSTGALAFNAAPDFENPTDANGDGNYEVTVRASDGIHHLEQALTITVTDVNDNTPVITSNGGGSTASVNVPENTTAVTTVKATDADAGATLTYSLSAGIDQGLFAINGSTGVLVFKTAPDFENPSDADGDGSYEVTVRAADGLHHMDQALTIAVTNANDHTPVITSNGGGSTASVNVTENTTAVTTVLATDADAGTTLTYSLSAGADQGLFSINGSTGSLAFKAAPDFENPADADGDDNYEVTVKASDGSAADEQALTITVTDVNDNTPVITSNGGGNTTSINVPENTTAVTTVKATDADAGATLTYSLSGGADQGLFSIDGSTGALIFKTAPNFENPTDANGDANYEVTVRASDGLHHVDQAITITVTDANDHTPVITSNGGGSTAAVNVAENATAITTVKATDADAGTTLTYSLTGGVDAALFKINSATGVLAFTAAPDFENPSDVGEDNAYEVTVGASDGSHAVNQAITITVTDVNDNTPVITSNGGGIAASLNVAENITAVTTAAATDADAGTTLTYSLSGGTDQGLFSINGSTGALVFKTAPDFENPADADQNNVYEVTLRASDGIHATDQAMTVRVTNENDQTPVIISAQHFTVDENSPVNTDVGTVKVKDADGPTTFSHWAITDGNTKDAFIIDANTGDLTVNNSAALDYETMNTFTLTLTVSDGVHTSPPETVTVDLNDVHEAPTAVGFAPETIYENQPAGTPAGKLSATAQDAGAVFTYSLVSGTGDTDNSLFNIKGNVLTTDAPLDYEQKNSYRVRVRATNKYGLYLEKDMTIYIDNVNEVPTLDAVADQIVCYSTEPQAISLSGISAGEDKGQTTSITVSADQAGLFKSLTASGNKIRYTPQEGAAGKAIVTIIVKDDGGTANGGVDQFSRSFTLTINPLPVITITADNADPVSKGILTHLTASGADSYQWANSPGIESGWNDAVLAIRPQQDATYTVTGAGAKGCKAQQSYAVQIVTDYKLICTNIVSPNGDGKNDTWIISNIDSYPNNEVRIFDRSGRMMYEKKNYDNQWNGMLNGGKLHEGTYYYVFIVDGGKKIFKGFIELLK